eukprot:2814635-Rhodomonas_salina.1
MVFAYALRLLTLDERMRASENVLTKHRMLRDMRYWHSVWCYALSGTDIAYAQVRRAVAQRDLGTSSLRVSQS